MKRALAVVAALSLCFAAFAQEIPQPQGYVTDYANVIDSSTEREIAAIANAVERQTGAQIAVLTVESMEPYATIEDYGIAVAEAWGVGAQGEDTGVILIVSTGERQARIEVGYGLEGAIPDGRAGRLLDEHVVPDLRRNNYGAGLLQGVAAVAQVIADEYNVTLENVQAPRRAVEAQQGPDLSDIVYIVFVLLVFGGRWFLWPLLFARGRRGFFGGGFGSSGRSGGFSSGSGFGGFGGGGFGGGGASRGF
ncbi:MAG: TPM domain-containing protein [Spirochaetales bacterium]